MSQLHHTHVQLGISHSHSPCSFYTFLPAHFSPSLLPAPPSRSSPSASRWMNDSVSVSLSVSVIDQTPAAAVTSWKDKPSWEQQYFYWSSPWPTGLDSRREWKSRGSHLLSWEPGRSWCGGGGHEGLYWWSYRWEVFGWHHQCKAQSGLDRWREMKRPSPLLTHTQTQGQKQDLGVKWRAAVTIVTTTHHINIQLSAGAIWWWSSS